MDSTADCLSVNAFNCRRRGVVSVNVLVIYDSAYGNTEKIAKAITHTVNQSDDIRLALVGDIKPTALKAIDLLIVGSPTQNGKPTQSIQDYLSDLPSDTLAGIKVAAFDTRYALDEHGVSMKLYMKKVGFAAPRIAASLRVKGGELVTEPVGFIVGEKEGPLRDEEFKRASTWIQEITKTL